MPLYLDPEYERIHLLIEKERIDLAEKELRKEIAKNPNDSQAFCLLSICLKKQKKLKEAEEAARKAISLSPDQSAPYFFLAKVYIKQNRLSHAVNAIQEAIKLDPNDADYYGILAALSLDRNYKKKALESAQKGLSIDPDNKTCSLIEAYALAKYRRKRMLAELKFKELLRRYPNESTIHEACGDFYIAWGKYDLAQEHYKKALKIDPRSEEAQEGLKNSLRTKFFLFRWVYKFSNWANRGIFPQICCAIILAPLTIIIGPVFTTIVIMIVIYLLKQISGAMLLLTKEGKSVFTNEESQKATVISGMVLLFLLLLVAAFIVPNGQWLFAEAVLVLLVMIPANSYIKFPRHHRMKGVLKTLLISTVIITAVLYPIDGSYISIFGISMVVFYGMIFYYKRNR